MSKYQIVLTDKLDLTSIMMDMMALGVEELDKFHDVIPRQVGKYVNTFEVDLGLTSFADELMFVQLLISQCLKQNEAVYLKGNDDNFFVRFKSFEGGRFIRNEVDYDPRREDARFLSEGSDT